MCSAPGRSRRSAGRSKAPRERKGIWCVLVLRSEDSGRSRRNGSIRCYPVGRSPASSTLATTATSSASVDQEKSGCSSVHSRRQSPTRRCSTLSSKLFRLQPPEGVDLRPGDYLDTVLKLSGFGIHGQQLCPAVQLSLPVEPTLHQPEKSDPDWAQDDQHDREPQDYPVEA